MGQYLPVLALAGLGLLEEANGQLVFALAIAVDGGVQGPLAS